MDWITIAMLVVAGMFGLSFVDVKSVWAKLGLGKRQPDPVDDLGDAIRALNIVVEYCYDHDADVADDLELFRLRLPIPRRREE